MILFIILMISTSFIVQIVRFKSLSPRDNPSFQSLKLVFNTNLITLNETFLIVSRLTDFSILLIVFMIDHTSRNIEIARHLCVKVFYQVYYQGSIFLLFLKHFENEFIQLWWITSVYRPRILVDDTLKETLHCLFLEGRF